LVDFSNGFPDPTMVGVGNVRDPILTTGPVLEACRSHRLPIVFTRIVYAGDSSNASRWC